METSKTQRQMTTDARESSPDARRTAAEPVPPLRVAVWILAMLLVFAALIFVPAGRLDWVPGWVYMGLLTLYVVTAWVSLQQWNPELIARRMRIGAGTKTWDKIWSLLNAPVMGAVYIVAGLEVRHAETLLPGINWLLGLLLFVPGTALLIWSMTTNPFFEKTVRIQHDHDHRVIDTGPYAFVRHPGYAGFVGWLVGTPLLLLSAWAFVPALLTVVGILIRTVLEDRTLRAELPGYANYAARVRFYLIPGIW